MNKILVILLLAFACMSSSVIQQPTVVIQQPMQPTNVFTATFSWSGTDKMATTIREYHLRGYQTMHIMAISNGGWILVMHKYK